LRDRDERGGIYGRQQHKSPETKVDVAGHRAGMVEPKDQAPTQQSAEIADVQVAAHLLRDRADHIHAREGAVAQPGGRSVLPRTDRVSMNTERPGQRGLRSEEALEPLEVRRPTDCGAGAIGARGLARSHIGLRWG
jgi:hypothetical protein